jgi:Apea-like HEPN
MPNLENKHIWAVLLHLVDWRIPNVDRLDIGNGVSMGKFEDSKLQQVYENLCYEHGLDDGDPYLYQSYFLVEPRKDRVVCDTSSVDNDGSRLCNMLAIYFGFPVGMSRTIMLNTSLNYAGITEISHGYTNATEHLGNTHIVITQESIETFKKLWSSICLFTDNYERYQRLYRTLDYFNYSWRGFYLDQVCINLSIVLESLFSPSGSGELSHQISYNAAYFLGTDKNDRANIYKTVKKFYGIRSSLVHGEWPNSDDLCELTKKMFIMCSQIIQRILIDSELIEKFSDKNKRYEMFKDWLFH